MSGEQDTRQLLTQSRLASARLCQRLHKMRYNDGYRALREEEALSFGTLMHNALEAWWLSTGDRLSDALAVLMAAQSDEYTRALALVMMAGYHERWGAEQYEVLAVEQEFTCDLINPVTGQPSRTWRLSGKLDAIVKDAHGRTLIVEHKTSSSPISPGATYWQKLKLDGQLSMYWIGARSLGYDISGVVYDVLGKPALRPLEANSRRAEPETPEEYKARLIEAFAKEPNRYLARGEVVRLDHEIDDAMLDIWDQAKQLRESQIDGRAPKNPDSCEKWGRMCAFFSVCCGEASLDDPALFVRSDNVHPELSASGGGKDANQKQEKTI